VLPRYPEEARKNKTQGVVVLRVSIAADGRVTDVKVLRAPTDQLGGAAAEAIRQWTYEPARDERGSPFPVEIDVVTTFRLQ
jgi:protein TonB